MSATGPPDDRRVYQLKVTLLDTAPPVWRRFLVPAEVSLHRLHLMLQRVMGWENYHLYRFQIASAEYSEPDDDEQDYGLDYEDSTRATLGRLVSDRGTRFLYDYDFGDNWLHELRLEDVLEGKPDAGYPLCVEGRRACPPEDCGGPWGYAEMLEVIADPEHPEYLDRMEWLGGGFDPDAFDAGRVNRMLDGVRQRRGYTEKQGQYLSFIYYYTAVNGYPPSEADMQRRFNVTPSAVHQMVLRLEREELIKRMKGQPRSIRVLVPAEQLPMLR